MTINKEQRLYVLDHGDGFTCLGFDVAFRQASAVAVWLRAGRERVDAPSPKHIGTEAGYLEYEAVIRAAEIHYNRTGERCPVELTDQLIGAEGKTVQVTDTHGNVRRFVVGRSTGWMPVHLEVPDRRATGGVPVSGAPFASVEVIR